MPYPEEPTAAVRRSPRRQSGGNSNEGCLDCLAVRPNARVRVDALEEMWSHCCWMRRVKWNEFSFAFEEDTGNAESCRIHE
jgi:hypothetical protein